MKLTDRQTLLLQKLDEITFRKKMSGTRGYFLGIEDCTTTINSLIVKGLVKPSEDRRDLHCTRMTPRP